MQIILEKQGSLIFFCLQVRVKRDHPNRAKFEPDQGLDPTLDLALVGADWQLKVQGRASNWQDNLVVTSPRSGDHDVLTQDEVCIFSWDAEGSTETSGNILCGCILHILFIVFIYVMLTSCFLSSLLQDEVEKS